MKLLMTTIGFLGRFNVMRLWATLGVLIAVTFTAGFLIDEYVGRFMIWLRPANRAQQNSFEAGGWYQPGCDCIPWWLSDFTLWIVETVNLVVEPLLPGAIYLFVLVTVVGVLWRMGKFIYLKMPR